MTGLVDLHSHHLPGLDDGPKSLEASVDQVRRLGALGYGTLCTTPHVIQGSYEYGRERLEPAIALLQEAVGAAPEVRLGAEHRFDGRFLELLEADELIPLGGVGRTVLVEFAWPKLPPTILEVLYRIQLKGYVALMAHPDRYQNDDADFARLATWVDRGGLLQVELGSLVGRYGSDAKDACKRLLGEDLVAVAAGDVHAAPDVDLLVRPGLTALAKAVGNAKAEKLCCHTPARLLEANV
jgi:protein-tyrosine phosphatase